MASNINSGFKETHQSAQKRTVSKEEKKFAQISQQSIKLIADASGHSSIPEEIAISLAEDVSYRLREIAHQCGQVLRHTKRRKLNGEDVNQVFTQLGLPKVFGYSSTSTSVYYYAKEAKVCVPVENTTDFEECNPPDLDVELGQQPVFEATWVAAECPKETHNEASSEKKSKEKTGIPKISSVQKTYHQQCLRALLDDREDLSLACLEDLKTNPKLGQTLPLFVQSFQKLCSSGKIRNERIASRLLQAIRALLLNHFCTTSPYGEVLLPCLLQLVLLPIDYHISCSVGHSFLKMLLRCRENSALVFSISNNLHDIVVDNHKPLEERCKAIMVLSLMAKGVEDAKLLAELSLLIQAWAMGNNDDAIAGHYLIRACSRFFKTEMQRLCQSLPDSACQYQVQKDTSDSGKQIGRLYAMASQCFGDRLQSQLGTLPFLQCQVFQGFEKKGRLKERPLTEKQYWVRKQNPPVRKTKPTCPLPLKEWFEICTLKDYSMAWNVRGTTARFPQRKPATCYYPNCATLHLLSKALRSSGRQPKGSSVQLGTEHPFYVI